ncbi:MAG: hypothetical protein PHS07_00515 [Patescibacteria group bacterium]|nr:hypothetical protein [Patescibacteria group bacterium]
MSKKILFLITILILILPLSGCITIKTQKDAPNGGIFKAVDGAIGVESWQQKNFIEQIEIKKFLSKKTEVRTIDLANIKEIIFDPQESQILYIITNQGLHVSYDGAEKWTKIHPAGNISSLATHPSDRNILYLAVGNLIYKTWDAGNQWQNIYTEATGAGINSLAIDSYDARKVYAGRSDGTLIRSLDNGDSWDVVEKFDNPINKILINKNDTRIIYIVTQDKGVFKTTDLGANWQDIINSEVKKEYKGITTIYQIMLNYAHRDAILMATNYGLVESLDGGQTWQAFNLLSAPNSMVFYSLAVNPQNDNYIYYGTKNNIYKTTDRGGTWITQNLPTSRTPTSLKVDLDDGQIIYMGVTKFEEKKGGLFRSGL